MVGGKKDFSIKKTRNPPTGGSGQLFTQGHPSEIQHFGTDHGKSMSNLIGQSYPQMGAASYVGNASMQQLPAAADGHGSSLDMRQKIGTGGQRSNKGSAGGASLPGQQRKRMSRGALISSGKRLMNNSGTYNAQAMNLEQAASQGQPDENQ